MKYLLGTCLPLLAVTLLLSGCPPRRHVAPTGPLACVPFDPERPAPPSERRFKGPSEIPQNAPAGVRLDCPPPPRPWSDYRGTDDHGGHPGGCGAWAIARCNRMLAARPGHADPQLANSEVSKDELDCIAAKMGTDPKTGGADVDEAGKYYTAKGCTREFKYYSNKASGDETSYAELKAKLASGCDVKIYYENGGHWAHIETVTGTTAGPNGEDCVQTDSWGAIGTICGNNTGSGPTFSGSTVARLRQPGWAMSLWVEYICNCP